MVIIVNKLIWFAEHIPITFTDHIHVPTMYQPHLSTTFIDHIYRPRNWPDQHAHYYHVALYFLAVACVDGDFVLSFLGLAGQ